MEKTGSNEQRDDDLQRKLDLAIRLTREARAIEARRARVGCIPMFVGILAIVSAVGTKLIAGVPSWTVVSIIAVVGFALVTLGIAYLRMTRPNGP